MSARDFVLLVLVCVTWGLNTVLSKVVVGTSGVPPLFFAAVRFLIVAVVTLPWLLPMPRPRGRMAVIAVLMGAGSFALMFLALTSASPSAISIVVQIGVPFTTALSVLMLGERVHWRRGAGMALTLAGVLTLMWNPAGLTLSAGLWFVVAGAFAGALGAVLMKQMPPIAPLRYQAWVGALSFLTLAPASLLLEQGQVDRAAAMGWSFVAILLFAALISSVAAHTTYYALIQRYEANLIAPLTLMTPLSTIALGVVITGDRLDGRMIVGALLSLAGVLVVALRARPATPLLAEREQA